MAEPGALPAPAGYCAVRDASDLHYSWLGAWGAQRLIGTEPITLRVFNAGYALENVRLRVCGTSAGGSAVYEREFEIASLENGATWTTEIPSYEIAEPLIELVVGLVDATFAWAG
ncbi:MAG: hypothetical protein SF069_17605 [Phycisphaerae bacterium]|nr:hypothetical protein [Phycisphaerae bacterium]